MSDLGYREIMGRGAGAVSAAAVELGEFLVVDAITEAEQNEVWGEYDERVTAERCSPPEEVFGERGGAMVRHFAEDMHQAGYPGSVAMNPVQPKPEAADKPAPSRSRHALTLEAVDEPDTLAVSRWAALRGKVAADKLKPVVKEPTHGRTYVIGTTESYYDEEAEQVVGRPWTSARPVPDVVVVVARGADDVEVGVVRGALNARNGNIVGDGTQKPLPVKPGQELRLGVYERAIPLTHVTQVEMDDDVRALLPERPMGALFLDAHDDLGVTLATVAKRALASQPASRLAPARVEAQAPVVATRQFPNGGETADTQGVHAAVDGAAEVVLEPVVTTGNGHVPTQRTGDEAESAAK